MKKVSMKTKVLVLAVIAVAVIVSIILTTSTPTTLMVATTTSLYDTGLWDDLAPIFEEKHGVKLHVSYAGTGIALEYGKRGDVDAVAIHDKAREEQFVADGYGVERVPFAYNYFLIVGPPDDPAGLRGLSPEDAFKKLMEVGGGEFVSRGDDSGTHAREKAIWQAAGFDYESVQQAGTWYIEAGRGMGPTLLMASEKGAYTLTDNGTFLAYEGDLSLEPIVETGAMLLNVYSIIAVSPDRYPETKLDMANNLVAFLVSPEIQELIGNYGVEEYGMPLFMPCAGGEPEE
ncbi:MAG: substrate-binding domain-containing protein [Dehalococcoidia bacterium]|jgi:tungstate transport system substrate-binding protein